MNTQGSEAAYNELFQEFMAIEKENLQHYNLPLDILTIESHQLALAAIEDKQALLDTGLDPAIIDRILLKVKALVYAAAQYQSTIDQDPDAKRQWDEKSPAGYELRDYFLRFCSFAFRKDQDLSASVSKIKEGRGDDDMVLDLLSLYILSKENEALLSQMNMFDAEKIPKAKELHDELSLIRAQATLHPKKVKESKVILDHAYSFFNQDAAEIRDHGKFVFEGKDRYQAYVSDYRSNLGKIAAKTKLENAAKAVQEPTAE